MLASRTGACLVRCRREVVSRIFPVARRHSMQVPLYHRPWRAMPCDELFARYALTIAATPYQRCGSGCGCGCGCSCWVLLLLLRNVSPAFRLSLSHSHAMFQRSVSVQGGLRQGGRMPIGQGTNQKLAPERLGGSVVAWGWVIVQTTSGPDGCLDVRFRSRRVHTFSRWIAPGPIRPNRICTVQRS